MTPRLVLYAGIILLLSGPLVALAPHFNPPPNGCPCPEGFPDVSYPLGSVGIALAVAALALIFYGGLRLRGLPKAQPPVPRRDSATAFVAMSGVILFVLAGLLSEIDLTGPGWSILLYQGMRLYLGMLGIAMLLFAGFASITGTKVGSLFLAVGAVFCGISVLLTYILSSEFALRCFPDVGCSPALAASTVSEMTDLGYLLAAGTFLLALGFMSSLRQRRNGEVTP